MRRAHTLPELVLTLALLAIVAATAVPALAATTARWQVRAAVADLVNALVLTREAALARGAVATFVVDAARGEVTVTCAGDTVARRAVGTLHGVALAASSDTVRYAPDGVATGVSNTTLLVVRGSRIDSVIVSRLGRVRWSQ
ncbi:MAG: GspH/FimT family pseudopilin [Gemmatimonadetes bacterium]|nr:GspH/FimT family pseudopilin [Gemmatimonadota bacterium]